MKRLCSILLSLALVLTLAACGGPVQEPGSASGPPPDASQEAPPPVDIPFSLAAYPSYSFHPVLALNRANLTLAPLLYEPLFQVDAAFRAIPVLCQAHTVTEDKLCWTFTLRSGVTFSDGSPLTGEVVAAALELARQPGSRYAQRLRDVSAITAGENSITIYLRRPKGDLPVLLDIPIALSGEDRAPGTGPYVLSGTEDDLTLTARSGWWQGKTLPTRKIPLTQVGQSDDLISAFASGGVGLVDVDLMGTNALGYSGNYETWDYATTDFLYLGFNTQSGMCQNAKVRQALARAVDRDSIAQVDYARHAVSTALPVHPSSGLFRKGLADALSYDPEQVVAQLEERKLLGRSLVLLVNSENTAKAGAAQRIAGQLEAAGMEITLSKLPFDDYVAALKQGAYDLYLGETVLTADFDLAPLLSSSGSLNYGLWQDSQTDSLLYALHSAQGEARATAADNLFAHLNEHVPIVPICFKNGSALTQWGRLEGLSPLRGNVFHQLENWSIQ